MEAVGAAAAIAELSGLSLKAGKAAKGLVQSFRHAPAEIVELNSKLERLHALIQQIDMLCAELPAGTDSHMLLPPEHRLLLSLNLQRTLDSLTKIKGACAGAQPAEEGYSGLRDRLRWATLDKKKAQRFLQDVRLAESELDIMLQILAVQTSLVTLSVGQASLHAELKQSLEEVKTWIRKEISEIKVRPN
ncbi:hypothetical protein SLS62_007672 [Diatrype stigma]|uniref:Uncharacterized protein n=1 Tax=Diatrype stigma TaxID=117547 RepID=A0AAN9UMT2_9PEZI